MSYSLAFSQSLFMMLYIADKVSHGSYEFIPTPQLSHDLNIPPSTAALILRRLTRAAIIEAREGSGGGVRLAMPPDEVTVLTIFLAVEQQPSLFQTNVQLRAVGEKPTRAQQTIRQTLESAENAMQARLQAVTLKDLMASINP